MERLPDEILAHRDNDFRTPSEVATSYPISGPIDVPDFISWADLERDLSAWLGNAMQQAAARALYGLRGAVHASGDRALMRDWQRLSTSDHLYYMCTKWFSDGDVHKYFNPYESPYEAYIAFMNVLNDLALRTGAREEAGRVVEEPHLLYTRAGAVQAAHLH
jgi:alpha-amylase